MYILETSLKEIYQHVAFLVECVSDNLFGLNFQPLFHDKFIFTVDGC